MADWRDPAPGSGERALKANRRRVWLIMGMLAASGFVIGFVSSRLERNDGTFLGDIPPVWAIVAALSYVIAVGYGSWRYFRVVDELERHNNRWAAAIGLHFFLIGYPVWFLMWKGGLAPEPRHEIIFAATYLALLAAYSWKKLRG